MVIIAQANAQFQADGIHSTIFAFRTADNASDFVPSVTTLTLLPEQHVMSTRVWLLDDDRPEGEEAFSVRLARPQGGAEVGDNATVEVEILPSDDAFGIVEFVKVRGFLIPAKIILLKI